MGGFRRRESGRGGISKGQFFRRCSGCLSRTFRQDPRSSHNKWLSQVLGSIGYLLPHSSAPNQHNRPVKDPRFPLKSVAFGDEYRESYCAGLPTPKHKLKTRERDAFCNPSGSSARTTSDPTYYNVPVRGVAQLARMAPLLKQEVVRLPQPPALPEGCDEHVAKGHPLVWQELKPIGLWKCLFRNFGVGHVFNLTECSGAAAIAALELGIGYEGVCANAQHAKWLDRVMDKAALAVYADGEDMCGLGWGGNSAVASLRTQPRVVSALIAPTRRSEGCAPSLGPMLGGEGGGQWLPPPCRARSDTGSGMPRC